MRGEGRRFGPLDLIADVDEAVVDAHFELGGRGVPGSLVVVEFFETLEGYDARFVRILSFDPNKRR